MRNRKDMAFLARWKGYTNKDDTWELYDNVRQTQAFVDYCTEKKMRLLVSKNIKSSNVLYYIRHVYHVAELWNLMQDSILFLGGVDNTLWFWRV